MVLPSLKTSLLLKIWTSESLELNAPTLTSSLYWLNFFSKFLLNTYCTAAAEFSCMKPSNLIYASLNAENNFSLAQIDNELSLIVITAQSNLESPLFSALTLIFFKIRAINSSIRN